MSFYDSNPTSKTRFNRSSWDPNYQSKSGTRGLAGVVAKTGAVTIGAVAGYSGTSRSVSKGGTRNKIKANPGRSKPMGQLAPRQSKPHHATTQPRDDHGRFSTRGFPGIGANPAGELAAAINAEARALTF